MRGIKIEISTSLKKLYQDSKNQNTNIGCIDRATILYYIMKSKNLNPKIKRFYFKDNGQITIPHCVIVINNMVYDTNIKESQNPLEFSKYEEMQKGKNNPKSNLIWEDWEKSTARQDYIIPNLWDYLDNFDEELQKELRPLIKKEYKEYLKEHPHARRD